VQAEPVVLFVQWRSMVRETKAFLNELGLRVLTLDGNATQRATTLESFKANGVLLLCLEDSFAGLHLAHARCVIFAHAIVGDRDSVQQLERQAIARCVRQGQTGRVAVHSFVVTESVEESLWHQTHATPP
jgi:SNF2 family DNA or RNA helicase